MTPERIARFWSFVTRMNDGGCWLWSGLRFEDAGYGRFSFRQGSLRAHRVAYHLTRGSIPEGMLVCHLCDVPHCVNPDHLFVGTQADNIADKVRKGRQARGNTHGSMTHPGIHRGERNPAAKLTSQQVFEIRDIFSRFRITKGDLGRLYGITGQQVNHIVRGRAWA